MWCWAASGEMCMEFLGTAVTQCDEANKQWGRTDCCNTPVPSACVNGGWPEFDKYNFSFDRTSNTALTWDQLKNQIYCLKKPIAFSWHWNGGGGHMMVARGFRTLIIPELRFGGLTLPSLTFHMVEVNNPLPPNVGTREWITSGNYVSGTDHSHWNDYYNIRRR